MEDYKAHLRQAETELEAMEAILHKAPSISIAPTPRLHGTFLVRIPGHPAPNPQR